MTESRISVYANSPLEGSGMEKMNMLLMLPIANVHWNDFSWDSGKGTIQGLRLRDSRDSRDYGTPKTPRLRDSGILGKGTIHGLRL